MVHMNEIPVTLEQMNLMKHSIGFEQNKVKRGKYEAYRNYFCAGQKPMDEFEELIIHGWAVKDIRQEQTYYFITKTGIEFLEKATGVKITESD